jgi:hypothetical protein
MNSRIGLTGQTKKLTGMIRIKKKMTLNWGIAKNMILS